jgi:hypothetical protein
MGRAVFTSRGNNLKSILTRKPGQGQAGIKMREYSSVTRSYIFINAVSLHFMYYNFARIHRTLRVTLAMEAGVTDYV